MKRARNNEGSVVLDKRIKAWTFSLVGERQAGGSRKSAPRASTPPRRPHEKAAKPLRDAFQNQDKLNNPTPTVSTLVEQYRAEKMPKRFSTRYGYECWREIHASCQGGEILQSQSCKLDQ